MSKKSLGYVELEWICPSCSTRNPGSKKTCLSCGLPQPEDVQFEQPAQEKLVQDEAKLKQARAEPDIHCHYCGSRNSAGAAMCSQCGADLSKGARRAEGRVVGSHRDQPVAATHCPACGTANAPDASKCSQCGASLVSPQPIEDLPQASPAPTNPVARSVGKVGIFGGIGVIGLLAILCVALAVGYFVLASRTTDRIGTVNGISWERSITIEEQVPVEHNAWRNEIPTGGGMVSCQPRLYRTVDEPVANSREICGTPYTVDSGTGFGEVVQDCQYEVYEDYCVYTVQEWREVDNFELGGDDSSPHWPTVSLASSQREGERHEQYYCHFSTDSGPNRYGSGDPQLLALCQIGSQWVLKVNAFDTITDMEPLR